jgi:hypothetical protein
VERYGHANRKFRRPGLFSGAVKIQLRAFMRRTQQRKLRMKTS